MPSRDLTEYFRNQAAWRRTKAEEYPEDARNEQSARALESLADYVDSGEAKKGAVAALEAHIPDTGAAVGGEEAQREVARYGFGYEVGPQHHEGFLDELWLACMRDAYEFAGEHGLDWTDELHPFEVDAAKDGVSLPTRYWERRPNWTPGEQEEAVLSYRETR
jgi:hypothetical protein